MLAKIGLRATIIATAVFLVESIQLHNYYIAGAYVLLGSVLSTTLEELR